MSTQTETVTVIVTQTVTATVTPEADPGKTAASMYVPESMLKFVGHSLYVAFSRGVSPGGHLGKVVSELMSWAVTVLAGFLVI